MELRKLIEGLKKNGLRAEAAREIAILQYSDAVKVDEAMREFYPEHKPAEAAAPVTAPAAKTEERNYTDAMDIATLCELSDCPERAVTFINERKTVDEVRATLLKEKEASRQANGPQRVQNGADETDKFRNSSIGAMMLRSGVDAKHVEDAANIRKSGIIERSLFELCQETLIRRGIGIRGMNKDRIIARAMASDDFPYIIGTGGNRILGTAYLEAPGTFQKWTKPGSLSDFKATDIVKRSGFANLEKVREGQPYNMTALKETKESVTMEKLGNVAPLTREMVYNDDLGAFTGILQALGMAAKRTLNHNVYQLLFTTDTLADGSVLFVAGHSNIGSTAAISNTTVGELVKLLRKAKGPNNEPLNLPGKYFLVNTAKETVAQQYLGTFPVAYSTGTSIDPYRGQFEIICDAELDNAVAAPTAYFLMTDPRICDTITVFYLNGRQEPELFQEESRHNGEADAIFHKVRFEAVPGVVDYRGMTKNVGA